MADNFSFILDGVLAGMERPGTCAPLGEDLKFLKEQGIGAVVSLTETPLDLSEVRKEGFQYLHLPVEDFMPPSLEQIRTFMVFFEKAESEGVAVVTHCAAGRGRTGTVLACALVRRGYQPEDAIAEVRRLRPASIETQEQEELIRKYADMISRDSGEDLPRGA